LNDFAAATADFDVLRQLQPTHEVRRIELRLESAIRGTTFSRNLR
jgi:hypothetical protein